MDCFVNVNHQDKHFLNVLSHLIIETLRSTTIATITSNLQITKLRLRETGQDKVPQSWSADREI